MYLLGTYIIGPLWGPWDLMEDLRPNSKDEDKQGGSAGVTPLHPQSIGGTHVTHDTRGQGWCSSCNQHQWVSYGLLPCEIAQQGIHPARGYRGHVWDCLQWDHGGWGAVLQPVLVCTILVHAFLWFDSRQGNVCSAAWPAIDANQLKATRKKAVKVVTPLPYKPGHKQHRGISNTH